MRGNKPAKKLARRVGSAIASTVSKPEPPSQSVRNPFCLIHLVSERDDRFIDRTTVGLLGVR